VKNHKFDVYDQIAEILNDSSLTALQKERKLENQFSINFQKNIFKKANKHHQQMVLKICHSEYFRFKQMYSMFLSSENKALKTYSCEDLLTKLCSKLQVGEISDKIVSKTLEI